MEEFLMQFKVLSRNETEENRGKNLCKCGQYLGKAKILIADR
jgi:hypothetical protein